MTAFFRFPHTPHLAWLGSGAPREDKVLTAAEVQALLSGEVIVEEKVDGANLGLSLGEDGSLRAQHRGRYLELESLSDQWKLLERWLSTRRHALEDALAPDLILFGEWCYAVHSVRYTRLPDWFLAFDVYDRSKGKFWSVQHRNELVRDLHVAVVPEIGRGRFDLGRLQGLLGSSKMTDGLAEGLYVRREEDGHLVARAKLVRAEFVQNIHEHWSKRRLEANQMVRTVPHDPRP